MSTPSRFRKLARKRADCETASGELVLYGKVPCGVEFDSTRNVKNKTSAIATEVCGFGLRSRCSNRNKLSQPGCVERSVRVVAIATRKVSAQVCTGEAILKARLLSSELRVGTARRACRPAIIPNVKVCV